MKAAERYQQAEALRQAILDYLNAQCTPKSVPEIAEAIEDSRVRVASTCYKMVSLGELLPNGRQNTLRYTAIAATTISAVEMETVARRGIKPNRGGPNERRAGVYRNDPSKKQAIPNQGGQGVHQPRMSTALESMV